MQKRSLREYEGNNSYGLFLHSSFGIDINPSWTDPGTCQKAITARYVVAYAAKAEHQKKGTCRH